MNPQSTQKSGLSFSLLGGALTIIVCIMLIAYFFYGLEPAHTGTSPIEFKIVKGDGFKSISARLSQESLVRSIFVFKLYAFLTGTAQKFQPGVYELTSTMSVPQIVKLFVGGGKNEVTLTVPEGATLKDIDALLAENEVIQKDALVRYDFEKLRGLYPFLTAEAANLEGFLFPDTYRFERNSAPELVVKSFLENFQQKAWLLLAEKQNWYESLILASFLEREVITFEDRRFVAGILLKRLKVGMPLQVDATVSYAKCGGNIRACENPAVAKTDLAVSSPYNTYTRLGFTPTPIANPGQAAIKAALTPRASAYLYYLTARGTKETMFSKTLEEHNTKRAKYL